jgi:hypothetical protein
MARCSGFRYVSRFVLGFDTITLEHLLKHRPVAMQLGGGDDTSAAGSGGATADLMAV